MATVRYSVPDEVKQAFNRAFAGHNRSAIIAELMMRAVEEQERLRRRARAIDRLLALRRRALANAVGTGVFGLTESQLRRMCSRARARS